MQSRQVEASRIRSERLIQRLAIVAGALVAGVPIGLVAVQAVYPPPSSMDPTLRIGDRFYVNKLSYVVGSAQRGDFVLIDRVLSSRANDSEGSGDLIRRVIALEGEIVEAKNNTILVIGQAVVIYWPRSSLGFA